jgi:hypothetical protein
MPLRSLDKPRRKYEKPGDLKSVRKRLWWGILAVQDILEDPETTVDEKLRGLVVLAQLTGSYVKLIKETEFEARLAALEGDTPPAGGPRRRPLKLLTEG